MRALAPDILGDSVLTAEQYPHGLAGLFEANPIQERLKQVEAIVEACSSSKVGLLGFCWGAKPCVLASGKRHTWQPTHGAACCNSSTSCFSPPQSAQHLQLAALCLQFTTQAGVDKRKPGLPAKKGGKLAAVAGNHPSLLEAEDVEGAAIPVWFNFAGPDDPAVRRQAVCACMRYALHCMHALQCCWLGCRGAR